MTTRASKHATRPAAFTLIELLVVIGVIAIVMSILIPALHKARETAKRTICAVHERDIGVGITMYAQQYKDLLPPPLFRKHPGFPWRSCVAYTIDTSAPYGSHITGVYNLGYLYKTNLVQDPKVFYCPSQSVNVNYYNGLNYAYDGYRDEAHPWPWNAQPWHDGNTRISYDYYPQSKSSKSAAPYDAYPAITAKLSDVDDTRAMLTDKLFDLEYLVHRSSSGARPNGINVLYGDTHVEFATNGGAFDPAIWGTGTDRPNENPISFRQIFHLLDSN